MKNDDAFIERLDFGQGDDPRVLLTGTRLPFTFGKVERLQIAGGRLTIVVSRDTLMEAAVAQEAPSFWKRVREFFS